MTNPIYQHFQPSEREFIDRVSDWARQVEDKQLLYCSYFLNPREQEILQMIANSFSLKYFKFPEDTEYAKLILAPGYYEISEEDFDVSLIEISYSSKFGSLEHRQILGAFIHETGLERREIGDILISENRVQIYVSQHLFSYFKESIRKIGKMSVELNEVPFSEKIAVEDENESSVILVNSLRLDRIIASSLVISRNLAANMIQSGHVRVNYSENTKNDSFIKIGDLISIRGFGRIKILKELGLTKKDKIKVEIEKIISRKGR